MTGEEYTIGFHGFESGRTEVLFQRKGPFEHWSLAVSPDDRWILYGENAAPQSDLMLIDNFR